MKNKKQTPNHELFAEIKNLPKTKNRNGKGRTAHKVSKKLNVSDSTVYQAKSLLDNGEENAIQQIINGEKSIKKAYLEMKSNCNTNKLPQNVSFSDILSILIESNQNEAVFTLLKHYLFKNNL